MHEHEESRAEAAETGTAEAKAEEPPAAARPGRRVTRRAAAESGRQHTQAPPPQRQTRRTAAAQAAAAIAADAGTEAKIATAADDTVAETTAAAPPADAEDTLHSTGEDQPAEEELAEDQSATPAETAIEPTRKRRGKQEMAGSQLQDTDAIMVEDEDMALGDAEHGFTAGLGLQRAAQASRRSAEDASATPTQSKQPAAGPPRTTRRMAAAER